MEIVVRGRQIELSQRFREHAEEKLTKLDRFGVPLGRIDVEVSKESNPRLADRAVEVELTCRSKGPVIRAEASAPDKYTALDLAFGRLEERLRRAADRRRYSRKGAAATLSAAEVSRLSPTGSPVPRNGQAAASAIPATAAEPPIDDTAPDDAEFDDAVLVAGPIVVREKVHTAQPMSVSDAVDHMELVGHDFYLFVDVATQRTSVVYRRRGFDYGLIRLDTVSEI